MSTIQLATELAISDEAFAQFVDAVAASVADKLAEKLAGNLSAAKLLASGGGGGEGSGSGSQNAKALPHGSTTTATPHHKFHYREKEAADALGISLRTLKAWRLAGRIRSHTAKRPIVYKWEHILKISQQMAKGELSG